MSGPSAAAPSPALAWALQALGLPAVAGDSARRLHGSMSGAGVFLLAPPHARSVVKVVLAQGDPLRLGATERELTFYQHTAPGLRLRTPRLLGHHSSAEGVALLLSAHGDMPQAPLHQRWLLRDWQQLAVDLAGLHAHQPITAAPATYGWVVHNVRDPDHDVVSQFWARPGEPNLIKHLFADADAVQEAIEAPDACLVHGDCHLSNIVQENEQLVWLDWQAPGAASPALDLAFCFARAVPEGLDPPMEEVLTDYAHARGAAVRQHQMNRAVLAAELAILTASWPHFARYNTPKAIDRVHDRVHQLAGRWTTN